MNGRFTHRRLKKDNKKRIDHHKNRIGKMLACLVFCVIVVNIEAQATEYRYDALGRLQYVQYENGDIVQYSYDANGNMQTYEYQAEKSEDSGDEGNGGSEDSGDKKEEDKPDSSDANEEGKTDKGDLFRTGTAVYQVTGVGKTKTVSFKRLTDKKTKSFKIPSTVKIKGEKYKVTKIASGAFQNRTKLTQVTVGNDVTGIGSKAFYGCKNLKKIIITSKKLKTVGVNAFGGIAKKASIRVPRSRYKAYKKILRSKGQAKSVRIVQDK